VDLFEYQGKAYLARFGVPVPAGGVAETVEAAVAVAREVGYPCVVKAQVRVGGRGKAGGVRVATSQDEARACAEAILGMDIKGHTVHRVWVERASDVAAEYYASFTLDRPNKRYLGMLSSQGGVEIEEVAETSPEAIARVSLDPLVGLDLARARAWVEDAGLDPAAHHGAARLLCDLYRCYDEGDCDLTEVNPLVLTRDGEVLALDAKVTLDDNAAFRHPEWTEFAGTETEDPREQLAHERGLTYIGLDGTVGIIANGAGLAMSTLDVVNQAGGSAANFLDIGGGANADVMANALEVINTDPNVRSILVNIFGGITRVDDVARGVLAALDRVEIAAPIVLRLDGTNAAAGRELLEPHLSDRLISAPTMLEAAAMAVKLAG
jgi:succinyl-CoA synthetase beta subunit